MLQYNYSQNYLQQNHILPKKAQKKQTLNSNCYAVVAGVISVLLMPSVVFGASMKVSTMGKVIGTLEVSDPQNRSNSHRVRLDIIAILYEL